MQKYGLTRTDFIKYQDYFFKMLEEAGVQDSNINRGNQDKSVNQKHDKSFKDILKYPTEMAKFLEQFNGEKILDILERGEINDMEDLFDRMEANERKMKKDLINKGMTKGRTAGILETVTAMIKNMLKYNEDDETIIRYTNAKQEDIDKVRKELNMQA